MELVDEPAELRPDKHVSFACHLSPILIPLWAACDHDLLDRAFPIADLHRVTNSDRLASKIGLFIPQWIPGFSL
jgi:hypothetical protein